MATLTAQFRTLKQYPDDNARNHAGSLVGKTIAVDPVHGRDFDWVYNEHGMGPRSTDQFTVIWDNECLNEDRSETRTIKFRDKHGIEHYGNATRFKVVPDAPAPAASTVKRPYQPDQFGDIMKQTRRMFR